MARRLRLGMSRLLFSVWYSVHGVAMKRGKHRPCPPATAPILEVLALLALLEWHATGTEERS